MSENYVPFKSGCLGAGLFLTVHIILLFIFTGFGIFIFFPFFLLCEFIFHLIISHSAKRHISFLVEKFERERIKGLRSAAKEMNFSFSLEEDSKFIGKFKHYLPFSKGSQTAFKNVMQGNIDDFDVTIMETNYRYGIYEHEDEDKIYTDQVIKGRRDVSIPGYGKWEDSYAGILAKTNLFFNSKEFNTASVIPYSGDHAIILFNSHQLRIPSFRLNPEKRIRIVDSIPDSSSKQIDISYYERQLGKYSLRNGEQLISNGEQLLFDKQAILLTSENIKAFIDDSLRLAKLCLENEHKLQKIRNVIKEKIKRPDNLASVISDLANHDWEKQFAARQILSELGGEVVAPLVKKIDTFHSSFAQENVVWVLKQVSESTSKRRRESTQRQLCSHCIVRCDSMEIKIRQWQKKLTDFDFRKSGQNSDFFTYPIEKFIQSMLKEKLFYFGCLECGQSRDIFTSPGEIVAVLDSDMDKEQLQTGRILRVCWLKRKSVFDFDRVEIIKTDDKQAEHFAIQVGNDNDSWRRPRYEKMQCQVASDCGLSENTLRILKSTFGTVKIVNLKL